MTQYFGTDGIRGAYGSGLVTPDGARRIGQAVATFFTKRHAGRLDVFIGCDTRSSSHALLEALVEGLLMRDIHVHVIGVIPTPGLSYLVKSRQATFGIMITASHNPASDNGIKLISGDGAKLNTADEQEISQYIDTFSSEPAIGTVAETPDFAKEYENFLVSQLARPLQQSWRLAVDCAHGAASAIAQRVFERIGVEATWIGIAPDGTNINDTVGSNHPETIASIILQNGLDGGIAFDGDGDRIVFVDSAGKALNGDHILFALAQDSSVKRLVATVMSNHGLVRALEQRNITVFRSPVGDHNVLTAISEHDAQLGGEQNGHIILPNISATSDGMLVAIHTLQQIDQLGWSIATWRTQLTLTPQALVNIPCLDSTLFNQPAVQRYITQLESSFNDGERVLIRPSGTEPIIRIMVEAADAHDRAEQIATELGTYLRVRNKAQQRLEDEGCRITDKTEPNLLEQIISTSTQAHIRTQTPRDANERFVDLEHAAAWAHQKGRIIHWLVGTKGQLAGIIWYRPEEDEAALMFAIRVYDGFMGKGLAKPFMVESLRLLHRQLKNKGQPFTDIILETNADNPAALHVYSSFGYVETKRVGNRVHMKLPVAIQQNLLLQ